MIIQGILYKSDDELVWLVEVPFLDLMTQADTRLKVPAMVKDAIELHVDNPLFSVDVVMYGDNLLISSNDPKKLVALLLKRQRQRMRLRLEDVGRNMRAKSINDYAQYEQGKHLPSFEKLRCMLEAIDPTLMPYLALKR